LSLAAKFSGENKSVVSLPEYVESVMPFWWRLHLWQHELIAALHNVVTLPDPSWRRIKIHAPPQVGKSVVIQAWIAYVLGLYPHWKCGLMSYNKDRASDYVENVLRHVQSDIHKAVFPDVSARLTTDTPSREKFTTVGRKAAGDPQASLMAMGIEAGVTGSGFQPGILVIDDPYASSVDAMSNAINGRVVRQFRDIMARMQPESRCIVCFHEYHDGDVGRVAIDEYGFREIRFPAVADDLGCDPTGREEGELLCPLLDAAAIERMRELDPDGFHSQMQGRALKRSGVEIQAAWFIMAEPDEEWPVLGRNIRYWDIALTLEGDFTASAFGGFDKTSTFRIKQVTEDRVNAGELKDLIHMYALQDPPGTIIGIEDSTATKHLIESIEDDARFRGKEIVRLRSGGKSKIANASGWLGDARIGRVVLHPSRVLVRTAGLDGQTLVRDDWREHFLGRCTRFDSRSLRNVDDVLDAVTGLYRVASDYKPLEVTTVAPLQVPAQFKRR